MTTKKTGRRSGGGADMVPNMAYYARHINLGGGGADMVPEMPYYAQKLSCCGGGARMGHSPSCKSGGGARAKALVEYATSTFYVG
jgi:hypothetical protein